MRMDIIMVNVVKHASHVMMRLPSLDKRHVQISRSLKVGKKPYKWVKMQYKWLRMQVNRWVSRRLLDWVS